MLPGMNTGPGHPRTPQGWRRCSRGVARSRLVLLLYLRTTAASCPSRGCRPSTLSVPPRRPSRSGRLRRCPRPRRGAAGGPPAGRAYGPAPGRGRRGGRCRCRGEKGVHVQPGWGRGRRQQEVIGVVAMPSMEAQTGGRSPWEPCSSPCLCCSPWGQNHPACKPPGHPLPLRGGCLAQCEPLLACAYLTLSPPPALLPFGSGLPRPSPAVPQPAPRRPPAKHPAPVHPWHPPASIPSLTGPILAPFSPSPASARPLTVILARDEQQKDAHTDPKHGLGASEQPGTGRTARSLAARCLTACLLSNHQRTRPVFLFTAIFISSDEARSSSGTAEGKGGMASGEEGPDPGDVPQPLHVPGSGHPTAASRRAFGTPPMCVSVLPSFTHHPPGDGK